MIDSITIHRAQVARANAAFAAHVPTPKSIEGGCVCVKCERVRAYTLAHKGHRFTWTNWPKPSLWCDDCSDWLWFQG